MHTGDVLRDARKRKRWTQAEASRRFGVSQTYLSFLEQGKRRPSCALAAQMAEVYGLSAVTVPTTEVTAEDDASQGDVAAALAGLKYPGFAHVKPRRLENPAVVVLRALNNDRLESRLAGALPWVLRTYPDLDWDWLVREAKLRDLQNRLGFVLSLARQAAQRSDDVVAADKLRAVEVRLEKSRLAREDVFGRAFTTEAEKAWLRSHRPAEAKHWNVLSSLTVEELHA